MHPFSYRRAGSVAEALRLATHLRRAGEPPGAVRFLAGGTTLYDLMKLGVEKPHSVIDVNRIPELSHLRLTERELIIGAGVRMSVLASESAVRQHFPMIAESLVQGASAQIRNMASIGGNVLQRTRCTYFRSGQACNKRVAGSGCSARAGIDEAQAVLGVSEHCTAAYPGDLATALIALDAEVDVLGPRGARSLPVAGLHRLPGATPEQEHTLDPDELITAVRVPVLPVAAASTYVKLRPRESYAFAWASAAVAIGARPGTDQVAECRIGLGGLATRPWRAREVETWLRGRPFDHTTARQAGELALQAAVPGRHNGFKIELGVRAVTEALVTAWERRA
jgi:xanthine dehydrogenase YagS FAD-binding subunit